MQKDLFSIPAGSLPPEIEETTATPEAQVEINKEGGDSADTGKGNENPLILGKFKTPDDLAKSYQELEQEHGRKSTELGSLRKQVDMLSNLVSNQSKQNNAPAQATDRVSMIDKELAAVKEQADAGDLTSGEAAMRAANLAAEKATIMAQSQFQNFMKTQKAEEIQAKFIKDNPDFRPLLDSGQLDAIKAENPMHDNFSAFLEYKMRQKGAEAQQSAKAAYDKGLQEGTKLKEGVQPASKVLSKPGTAIRQTNNQQGPVSDRERIAGMMDVLNKMRSGGGT